MSYKKLDVWHLARELSLEIHLMTGKLPKFEMYEEGQQMKRSSKSVRSNIVEGYGRRFYKGDYLKFLIYSLASNDETLDHLEMLAETKSLTNEALYEQLSNKIQLLSRRLRTFIRGVNDNHNPPPL
jgi:four helix bundle protein